MDTKTFLQTYQNQVKPYYNQFFKYWKAEAKKAGTLPTEMLDKFIDIYPRGKQLRGALSVLGYQVSGGKDMEQMHKASIVVELLETSILIADDIFDKDEIRRGVPTIYRQWEKKLPKQKELAQNIAFITALNGYYLALHALSLTKFSPHIIQKALEFYTRSGIFTGFGEAMDIYTPAQTIKQKQSSTDNIHKYKTIWYSAILPLKFGAILANASDARLSKIENYAQILGSIFQIQDDILGSFGDPAITGKANDQDIKEGRWTILIEGLFQTLSKNSLMQKTETKQVSAGEFKKDLEKLKQIMQKSNRTYSDIKIIKQLLTNYQVVDKAKQKAQSLLNEGLKIIAKITKNQDQQDTLKNLLYFVLERKK